MRGAHAGIPPLIAMETFKFISFVHYFVVLYALNGALIVVVIGDYETYIISSVASNCVYILNSSKAEDRKNGQDWFQSSSN